MDPVKTVDQIYACFGRGDIPGILERLHPDVAWDADASVPGVPWIVPRKGRQEVAGFFETLAGLEFKRFEVTDLLAGKSQVAAVIELEVLVKATGKTLRDLEVHLWTFDDAGRVVRFRHVVDTHAHHLAARA